MGTISKDFDWAELTYSKQATERGIINQVTTFEVRDALLALVRNVLQPLRDKWGKPLHINSGYRCPTLNALVGGVPTSQHAKGEAADVAAADPYKLARVAKDMGLPFDQMILYPTFVHFSHKLKGAQRGQVLYNKTYKGKRL